MSKQPFFAALRPMNGFTLIELLITVTVAAILLGLAVPSFRDFSIRNQLTTYTNEFISGINYARSEAVRRGRQVMICPTDDEGVNCAGTWTDGWMIFLDANSNGALDTGDALLKVQPGLSVNYSMDGGDDFADGIAYASNGSTPITGTFVICHDNKVEGARALLITPMRPRVATDTDGDRIPNDDTGTNIAACVES